MQSVMLNDKTAKLLESYSQSKKLSAEQAIAALLEEVTQIIKQDRAKQRQQTGR